MTDRARPGQPLARTAALVAAIGAALLVALVTHTPVPTGGVTTPAGSTPASTRTVTPAPEPTATPVPAPTSAAGYQRLWGTLDPNEWGAADVSISTPMPDGRVVWFYGDTLSNRNGFVNSTAITQDGGRLHVSHGGQQLLPQGPTLTSGHRIVYWIEAATTLDATHIRLTAAETKVGTGHVWDFARHRKQSRTALVRLDATGDVTFERWTGWTDQPRYPNDFTVVGKHHFTYSERAHPHLRLANGRTLWTKAQNWDDGDLHRNPDGSIRFADYAPIFYDQPPA